MLSVNKKTAVLLFVLVYLLTFGSLFAYEKIQNEEATFNPLSWFTRQTDTQTEDSETGTQNISEGQELDSDKPLNFNLTSDNNQATPQSQDNQTDVETRVSNLEKLFNTLNAPARVVYQTISQTIDNTITKTETIKHDVNVKELFPSASGGNPIYYDSNNWKAASGLYLSSDRIGVGRSPSVNLDVVGDTLLSGRLTLDREGEGNVVTLKPKGNTGHLSSVGGALYINNTENIGSALGIFSDAGEEALGNMINIKVNNPEFQNAAFYMDSFGTSNAVEIRNNTDDRSSNALSITNFNKLDSAVGIKGYELDRGTIKVTNIKAGANANASGISVDLQGEGGTAAQGIYVDSTSGTTGKLLRLRNLTIDRFVVEPSGSLVIGSHGTDTSITKRGNNPADEFFVGTTGAFRVQRSAATSEAFRVQVAGDTFGRWLGTSDGKLRWSSGAADYDVMLERSGDQTLRLTNAIFEARSPIANSDIMRWQGAGGARLGRFIETGGGHGWFEVSNSSGNALVRFRADGGDNFVNTGNFGIGTTAFGTGANRVVAIGNGTAPSTSIANGIQLFAVPIDTGGGPSSELQVRDEAGNVTTLSPHNFSVINDLPRESLDWAYYSENGDSVVNVNMAEVVRVVEQLSNQQLLFTQDKNTQELTRDFDSFITNKEIVSVAEVHKDIVELRSNLQSAFKFQSFWLSIIKPVRHLASVVFEKPTTFLSGLIFSNDLAGEVTISATHTYTTVSFPAKQIGTNPIVTVTPRSRVNGPYWVEKNSDSFVIKLDKPQSEPVSFDWFVVFAR